MTKTIGLLAGIWLALGARAAYADDGRGLITPMSADATSTLKDKKHAYDAWHAVDGKVGTAWCEGVKSDGVGEALSITGDSLDFSRLNIAAGYWKSDKLFAANNQPTELRVTVTSHAGDVQTFDVIVPDYQDEAFVDPGGTVDAVSIKIEFVAVAKKKLNDSCISHVSLFNSDNEELIPYLDSAASIDDLMTALFALNDAFDSCDSAQLETNTAFPLTIGKKKYKKLKDLVKACSPGAWSPGDIDFHGMTLDGSGQLVYGAGQERWHLRYDLNDDLYSGTWRLTKVETY